MPQCGGAVCGCLTGVEAVKHHPGQAALEGSQRVGAGVAFGQSFSVVDLAEAVYAELGDSNALQGHVELPVS
jgi:hypothetical protein